MLSILPLLMLLAAEPPAPPKGTLCVLPSEACVATIGTTIAVTPKDEERRFVWTSADGRRVVADVIKAKAESIDLATERKEIAVSLRGDATRAWPADTELTLGLGRGEWKWTVPARAVTRLTTLAVAPGVYTLNIAAPRHHALARRGVNVRSANATLGELRLEPLPALRGRVVGGDDKPLAGAQVFVGDMTLCTTADEQGAFRCEIPEQRPPAREAFVTYPGRAFRQFPLKNLSVENDLGTIVLGTGSTLAVKIERPGLEERTITAELHRDDPDEYNHTQVAKREVKAGAESIEFADLSTGTYYVVLVGSEPLERLATKIEIKESGTTEKTIRIAPFTLEGTATFGEEKINGPLGLSERDHAWRSELTVTDGRFGGTMWQHGVVTGFIRPIAGSQAEMLRSPELGTDPSRWTIALVARLITGRILDAETKQPVTTASMQLNAEMGRGAKLSSSFRPSPDGTFRVLASSPGTYQIRTTADGYAQHVLDVVVTESDRTIERDIVLERGVAQPVEVVWANGAPAANALVLEGVRDDRVNPQFMTRTDAAGRTMIRGAAGESRLLWVVPQEGSFGVIRLRMPLKDAEPKPMRITVPSPTGAIRLQCRKGEQEAQCGSPLLRYNGEWLPFMVVRFVSPDLLGGPTGDTLLMRLPAGTYEVWEAREPGEEAGLMSGAVSRPPAGRVGLAAGEQTVVIRR